MILTRPYNSSMLFWSGVAVRRSLWLSEKLISDGKPSKGLTYKRYAVYEPHHKPPGPNECATRFRLVWKQTDKSRYRFACHRKDGLKKSLFLFENKRIQKELFLQLHAPLSAKGSWSNDEDTTLTFSPKLADNNTSLYCFPNPTSSARITPLEKGDWNAKRAAITWWGFRSTRASDKTPVNLSSSAPPLLRDNCQA